MLVYRSQGARGGAQRHRWGRDREGASLHYGFKLTRQEFAFPRPAKHQKMIFYDRDGKNLNKAADIAEKAGYKNVKNYEGAWQDWQDKEAKSKK